MRKRLLGVACVAVIASGSLAACTMYDKPPQKMAKPKVDPKRPKGPVVEAPVKRTLVDSCPNVNHRLPPAKNPPRDPSEAARLVKVGDTARASADKPDANKDARRDHVLDSISKYQRALAKDPYDADATLKLAVAYDRASRKGCALVMLRRLEVLAGHRDFSEAADRQKALARDTKEWFADYRNEAMKEIP